MATDLQQFEIPASEHPPQALASLPEHGRGGHTPSAPLHEIEDRLAALLASEELAAEDEALFLEWMADVGETSAIAMRKRDACAEVLHRFDEIQAMHEGRIAQLQARIGGIQEALRKLNVNRAKLEGRVLLAVETYGVQTRGKGPKRLHGYEHTFSATAGRESVNITDEAQISDEFQRTTVKMPRLMWERLLACGLCHGGIQQADVPQATHEVMKAPIKAVLDANIDVPGAELKTGPSKLDLKARTE